MLLSVETYKLPYLLAPKSSGAVTPCPNNDEAWDNGLIPPPEWAGTALTLNGHDLGYASETAEWARSNSEWNDFTLSVLTKLVDARSRRPSVERLLHGESESLWWVVFERATEAVRQRDDTALKVASQFLMRLDMLDRSYVEDVASAWSTNLFLYKSDPSALLQRGYNERAAILPHHPAPIQRFGLTVDPQTSQCSVWIMRAAPSEVPEAW